MDWSIVLYGCLFVHITDVTVIAGSGCPIYCSCFVETSSSLETVHCVGKHIRTIPTGIPATTQVLLIEDANISVIGNESFHNLHSLVKVHLSSSELQRIESGTFSHMQNLSELCLNNNKLELSSKVYVPDIFAGLTNLKVLHLGKNSKVSGTDIDYPGLVWHHVPNLEDLKIDGLTNKTFPLGFSRLRNLQNLTMSGLVCQCFIFHLKKDTFSAFAVTSVRYLDISWCHVHIVDAFVFAPLRLLNTLICFHQTCTLHDLQNALTGLNETSIQYLQLNEFFQAGSNILSKEIFMPLKSTHVKHLYFESNCITWMDWQFPLALPSSMETMSFNGNYLIGDTHSLKYLLRFPNLTEITFSYIIAYWRKLPAYPIPLPIELETLIITGTYTDIAIPPLHFAERNKLRNLTWTNSTIHTFVGPISGLNSLEKLSLANVNCRQISIGYFKFFSGLKILNLSQNALGDMIALDKTNDLFKGLFKLEILDISENSLRSLSTNLLIKLKSLTHLHIQRNALMNFDLRIEHLEILRYIDISTNSISSIDDSTMEELSILMNSTNLVLDLSDNPLICDCEHIHFLSWLQLNRNHFVHYAKYECYFWNSSNLEKVMIADIMYNLQYSCASHTYLISITSVAILMFFVVLMVGLFHRYQMHLKYWFHVARRSVQVNVGTQNNAFKYDAFVSYAEPDEEFVINNMLPQCETRLQLHLCIHCRDFMPGTAITDNIVGAIQCSRKSVFIISKAFLKSEWCRYEFNMARMEHIYSGRSTIVIVMYEDVEELPLEIIEAMEADTYLYMTFHHRDAFWDLLSRSIKGEQI